jgi:hypothetical protein
VFAPRDAPECVYLFEFVDKRRKDYDDGLVGDTVAGRTPDYLVLLLKNTQLPLNNP